MTIKGPNLLNQLKVNPDGLREGHIATESLSSMENLLHDFSNYMEKVRGTMPSTIHICSRYIQKFLKAKYRDGPIYLKKLDLNDVREYVITKAKGYKASTTKVLGVSLKAFFRFLRASNKIQQPLEDAVPRILTRKLSTLPKYLTKEQLQRLLSSFNLSSSIGLRDRAMALLMVKVGLRAGEVAQLKIEDINWREGIMQMQKSKSRRAFFLPLPNEVGEALVVYLQKGRPYTTERNIFVTHGLPIVRPLSMMGVVMAIRQAFKRSALSVPSPGPHVLRHTLATQLLQEGANLKEIADILRHRNIDTTNIYARVDLKRLVEVALPWPEVQS